MDNLIFRVIPSIEIWTRDMAPVFVETSNGKLAIADFNFDSWGYADTLDTDTKTEEIYDEMEAEYQRILGVKKVIWLKDGLLEVSHTFLGLLAVNDSTSDYTVVTTNGHTDEFSRFVNDSTILLANFDIAELSEPIAQENHQRLEANFEILLNSKDQDGKPFTIIRLPLPSTLLNTLASGDYVYEYIKTLVYKDGSKFPQGDTVSVVIPASYLILLLLIKSLSVRSTGEQGCLIKLRRKMKKQSGYCQQYSPIEK
ncbi:agmatine deiminase family protein [Marivirga salinae]|uniref:Agmatine deiminase family protein n=1 Tax=Marivirga salinarum TaxID=3059078 RepID=A0AA51RDT7_9BACT|nr:agmatine deiminase family protein [Marivirga sp. BDSF4-3]WMN11069.1 agmatine deiminase family protein [Marivirga sp. BDSF4-3]